MPNVLLDIKYSDLKRDIEISPSRAGYNYIKISLKESFKHLDKSNESFDILYLSKHNKAIILLKNCKLAMTDPVEETYSFRYSVTSRNSYDFSKREYLQIKLKSYLTCY